MIVLVDSGGANIASVLFAFQRLGVEPVVTADEDLIRAANRVILPGVGAAADTMERLRALKLDTVVPDLTQPVLGICVGMQVLADHSEEGDTPCLGVLPGTVERLRGHPGMPVPHMGWNTLQRRQDCPLLHGLDDESHFYFVHSYAAPVSKHTVAATGYGTDFSAVAQRDNFFATQFHPERSASHGARLLQNFLAL